MIDTVQYPITTIAPLRATRPRPGNFIRLTVHKSRNAQWYVRATRSGRKIFHTETYRRKATAVKLARNLVAAASKDRFRYIEMGDQTKQTV